MGPMACRRTAQANGHPRKKKRTFFIPGQKGKQPTFGREETPIYAKRPKALTQKNELACRVDGVRIT